MGIYIVYGLDELLNTFSKRGTLYFKLVSDTVDRALRHESVPNSVSVPTSIAIREYSKEKAYR